LHFSKFEVIKDLTKYSLFNAATYALISMGSFIENLIAGHIPDAEAYVAALGLVYTILTSCNNYFWGLNSGLSILTTRAISQHNYKLLQCYVMN
jgi:Na+-driven multidrug efflux pump